MASVFNRKKFCLFSARIVLLFVSSIYLSHAQDSEISFQINEEVPVDTRVGSVAIKSGLRDRLDYGEFNTLSYKLLLFDNSPTNLFKISNNTGVIRTKSQIDRETECHYEDNCILKLFVSAKTANGQQFFTFTVAIIVEDINDNSPVFQPSATTVSIDEDASRNTAIPIPSASDIDIANNTLRTYELKDYPDTFYLSVSRKLDGSLIPQLYLKSQLDREIKPWYLLTVVALDGGLPQRSGELTVNVTINDVNDNAPVFSRNTYNTYVDEVTPTGSKVLTLVASDPDTGQNGRVSYRLGPRQSEEAYNTFRVERQSGNIVTLRDLTPMQGKAMRLVVEAVDHGVKARTAQAVVNIHIVDSVNNAPLIRMTSTSASRVFHVMENSSPGFVVTHFVVEDRDSGGNGDVTCGLHDNHFSLQRLKPKEYKVSVFGALDRETLSYYQVKVTCHDGGNPSQTSSVDFSVVLDDDNDKPPRFLQNPYHADVEENMNHAFVTRLHAEDEDLGRNADVKYSLGNVTSLVTSYIQVNETSGQVTTRRGLDYELFRKLEFQVLAIDKGKNPLTSVATVIINVLDKNDNRPQVPNGYFLSVMENSPIGTLVGRIQAIDPDTGSGGRIMYNLMQDNNATRLFNLTHDGEVRTLAVFDREVRDRYDINVVAKDYHQEPQTNMLSIRIKITDENDHSPVIDFPRKGNNTAYVTVGMRPNTTITRTLAWDADMGENASLLYSLVNGGKDLFEMDSRSGRVFTLRRVETKDNGLYRIRVFVRDDGRIPRSDAADLSLVVTQGDAAAAPSGFNKSSHIIIVAILIGVTIFIAILVFLIVLRFLRKDRRRDQRPKYTGGLPMAVKSRSASPDAASCDEGTWRCYDEAKRSNGPPGTRSNDVTYDANDDIIMFKLKLADQYRELEPEDKDPSNQSRDNPSNRNSVNSDLDGAPDVVRDRGPRLASFQVRSTPLHGSQSPSGERKLRACKMGEEMSSSGSKDLGGADSGRGTSDDGSQGRSSFTDDSGCPVSPTHTTSHRGTTPRHQGGGYSRPISGSTYDRPPLLMTFQSNAGDHANNGATLPSRRDFSYPTSSPRFLADKDRKVKATDDHDVIIHRGKNSDGTMSLGGGDPNRTSPKKLMSANGDIPHRIQNSSSSSSPKSQRRGNSSVVKERNAGAPPPSLGKGSPLARDVRLCSEPPMPPKKEESKLLNSSSPYTPRGVQETGFPSFSAFTNKNGVIPTAGKKPLFLGTAERSRLMNEANNPHSPFKNGTYANNTTPTHNTNTSPTANSSNSNIISMLPNPHDSKLGSCPQLFKDNSAYSYQAPNQALPSPYRSKSFNNHHDSALTLPFRSSRDLLNESVETQDDGNTTTTSGSYTIDHDDLNIDMPHTDVYV